MERERLCGMAESTCISNKSYIGYFVKYIANTFGVYQADRIVKEHLTGYLGHLKKKTGKKGLPISITVINGHINSAKKYLKWLYAEGYLHNDLSNVMTRLKTPRLLPKEILNHEQMRKLLDSIDTSNPTSYRDRTILELMYSSGLRVGEVATLKIDDIELNTATAKVMGKGSKERLVPIGKTAVRYLETYMRAVRPFVDLHNSRTLFLTRSGNKMNLKAIQRMVKRHTENVDCSFNITSHTFRRTCATVMLKNNAGIYHVKELLGHETLNTLKHYIRLDITDLKKTHAECHPREKDS